MNYLLLRFQPSFGEFKVFKRKVVFILKFKRIVRVYCVRNVQNLKNKINCFIKHIKHFEFFLKFKTHYICNFIFALIFIFSSMTAMDGPWPSPELAGSHIFCPELLPINNL